MWNLAVPAALAWALAALMLWWPRLPAAWRRRVAIATSAAGLAFLLAATQAEGLRELPTTARVVVGPAYVTATAAASASLYYYVLTAVCLVLGFAGLVFGEPLALWFSRHWLTSSISVSLLVTLVRFLLEKSAAPAPIVQAVGITWMAPVVGAYFAACLHRQDRRVSTLARELALYAFAARAFVALVGLATTALRLGTHYDVSPLTRVSTALGTFTFAAGSAQQVFWLTLVPQLVFWPVYTVAAGLAGAFLARLLPPLQRAPRAPIGALPETLSGDGPPAGAPLESTPGRTP